MPMAVHDCVETVAKAALVVACVSLLDGMHVVSFSAVFRGWFGFGQP